MLTIVTLTVFMRLLIFPLFLKQMRSSKKIQELAPQAQELRKRYKNDKQRMNQEVMALYQGAGANPLGGCLPILAQFPIFISMFTVLNAIADVNRTNVFGMPPEVVASAREAHVFSAGISETFWSTNSVTSKIIIGFFVAVSSLTTFLTVRQSVTRSMAQMPDNPMAQQQKILMYISPLFAIFSLNFPLGLILYWVTTNLWTLGQQHWYYTRHPMPQFDDKGRLIPHQPKPGLLSKFRKSEPVVEEAPPAAAAPEEPKVVRNQPSRQTRSKRSGSKKS
ncbi:membrane protein insertase YidC [Nonomuraea sp. NPDC050663]|uniref:membrane protein insertase YidC n=1 Tax=Nonomuraea sp. NPDC050663 TaxID=3364370 RepID=UPI00379DBEFE